MNRGLFFASMALRTASSFVSPGRALSLHHPALSPVRWVSTNPQQPQSQSQSQSQNTNIRPDNINSQQPQSLDSFVPPDTKIQIGDAITFEVISFGPLGASLQFLPSKLPALQHPPLHSQPAACSCTSSCRTNGTFSFKLPAFQLFQFRIIHTESAATHFPPLHGRQHYRFYVTPSIPTPSPSTPSPRRAIAPTVA